MISKLRSLFSTLFLLLFCSSCSSNLDTAQVQNLVLTPVYVANLSYFKIPANDFVINNTELSSGSVTDNLDVFRTTFFDESLKKAELDFVLENTIPRAFEIEIHFYNINNQIINTITLRIPAYTGTDNKITQKEIFENVSVLVLKRTKKIGFSYTMASGVPLTESSTGNLILKSSATIYLSVE